MLNTLIETTRRKSDNICKGKLQTLNRVNLIGWEKWREFGCIRAKPKESNQILNVTSVEEII